MHRLGLARCHPPPAGPGEQQGGASVRAGRGELACRCSSPATTIGKGPAGEGGAAGGTGGWGGGERGRGPRPHDELRRRAGAERAVAAGLSLFITRARVKNGERGARRRSHLGRRREGVLFLPCVGLSLLGVPRDRFLDLIDQRSARVRRVVAPSPSSPRRQAAASMRRIAH